MNIKITFTQYDNETGNAKTIAREIEQRAMTNAKCKAITKRITDSNRPWGAGTEIDKMNAYYTTKRAEAESMIESMIQAAEATEEEFKRNEYAKEIASIIAMNNVNRYINRAMGIRPKRPTWYD